MGIEVQRISIRNKVRMFETASQVRSERSTRFGPKMGIASIIVALMTGFLYYLYELVFPLVRFRSDLDNLPMLLLGAIPSVNRHRKGLVGLKADLIRKLKGWKSKAPLETLLLNFESDSFEAMAFKYVRTRIVNLNKHSKRVVIAVISGRSGEGKTFVAANLASAIARMGHRTILVDTDLRNPNLSRSYKMTNEMGLVDVLGELSDQGENSNLVRKIGPNLHILPAGKYRVDATERLSGDAFKELLAVLRLHYEYIILDTPPILSTAEALAMTIVADQICITITPGESRIDDVQRVLEKLVQTGSTNIGYVLNRSKAGLTPYIYPTEAKAVATDPSSRAS